MSPSEFIRADQIVSVVDPRPVEQSTLRKLGNAVSPFSAPLRTIRQDLDASAEIVQTIKELASPEPNFDARYKGAVTVEGIAFAWDGSQTVIHDDLTPDETNFLQSLRPIVSSQPELPSSTVSSRTFRFFNRQTRLEATPIGQTTAQRIGRTAIALTGGAIGFEAVQIQPLLTPPGLPAYGGLMALTYIIGSLNFQRRHERKALVTRTRAQVKDLDAKIHNSAGGIVFPRDSRTVNVGADKNQVWQGIYQETIRQDGHTTHTVNPVSMIYTALKADAAPKEFWEQVIGEKCLRDYTHELADLCQIRQQAAAELTRLKNFAKNAGTNVQPTDIVLRQTELEHYQAQMDSLAQHVTDLVSIRREQQRYIRDADEQFQSIITTGEQDHTAIRAFADCALPQGSLLANELLAIRQKLTDAIALDIFLQPEAIPKKPTAHILNRLTKYMEKYETGVHDASSLDIYYRALHDKFVGDLPSLSATFGLPAPEKSAAEAAIDESKEIARLFGTETKVTVLDGLVYTMTEDNLTIYEGAASAREAAAQKESGHGIHIARSTRYEGVEFVHIPADKLDELGIAEDQLLPLFGKDDGRNQTWISYTAAGLITRMLRKADDAQLLWASGFGDSVKALAACYDACHASDNRHTNNKHHEAIFPLGLAVVRKYLAYVQPKSS